MSKYKDLPIYNAPEGWVIKYPKFAELADEHMHSFWPWNEPLVDNDLQELRTELTEAELNGIITVLKLFTLYELRAGQDYWGKRIGSTFSRPEIQRMATMFACVEMNSHSPFYNKINEVLNLDTEEFYSEWKTIENLSNRIEFIEDCIKDKDDLVSIAAFSFIEGAVLYSSFAFIKHFQSQECGKNLLKNICRGVDLSMVDESAHSIGGALLFRTILEEAINHNVLSAQDTVDLFEKCSQMATTVYNHECEIIDMIFQGEISGINKYQMKEFVKHRLNVCLAQLGCQELFVEEDTTIKDWFYRNTTSKKLTDFFTANGSEYNINWNEQLFGEVWK